MKFCKSALSPSRESVDLLLSGKPSQYALTCRIKCLERLIEDIGHFCPWPALQASLLADARKLRAAAYTKGRK